jgi:hypothetical protein
VSTGVGAETEVVAEWIRGRLALEPAASAFDGRVFEGVGPSVVGYPFCVFDGLSYIDFTIVGGVRVWVRAEVIVKAIAKSDDFSVLAAEAAAIDAVMASSTGAATTGVTGSTLESYRTRPFRMREESRGDSFVHLGGVYEIKAQGS